MRLTLLHGCGVVLTVLLFIARRRCTLQSIRSGKRRSIMGRCPQCDMPAKQQAPTPMKSQHLCANLREDWIVMHPKYKRDPEIDVDHEGIGCYPMG